jgi:lipopolysaccharide transport system ATP-binding protein
VNGPSWPPPDGVAVEVRGVTKTFRRDDHRSLKEHVLHPRQEHSRTFALRDVSLTVPAGRTLGLIGHNGAGKSVLLRLIGGVGRADVGEIEVHGRLAALFELGIGFHPELTGRESIEVTAVVSGMRRREARAATEPIVEFAELEEFIDAPLRTYSTGMQARLAFAIASHIDPEVLLVDEALAVGDLSFQARCIARLREMQQRGTTILLVSHEPGLVADLCDEVVWLRGGRVVGVGAPGEVTARYREAMAEETRRLTPHDVPDTTTPGGRLLRIGDNRFGSQEARLVAVTTLDGWGQPCDSVASGSPVQLRVEVEVPAELGDVQVGATLTRVEDGALCLDTSTGTTAGVHEHVLVVDRLDLAAGEYAWDVGLYSADWQRTLDHHWRAYPLSVTGHRFEPGGPLLAPPMSWRAPTDSAAAGDR